MPEYFNKLVCFPLLFYAADVKTLSRVLFALGCRVKAKSEVEEILYRFRPVLSMIFFAYFSA
jgi:hypothetical protein